MLRVFLCCGVLALAAPITVLPGDALPQPVQRFEQRYRSAHTLQAEFLERYLENGKEIRSEAGLAYFGKPGKMRWEYESPERNLFVIDGKWSWFFVPADHTVTRVRAKDSSDWRTPLAILAGEAKISRICERVDAAASVAPVDARGSVYRCSLHRDSRGKRITPGTPLAASSADTILFEVRSDSGELVRVVARDPGGVEIEFRFADWRFDLPLDPAKFRFEPPRGVAIVDGELSGPAASQGTVGSSEGGAKSRP